MKSSLKKTQNRQKCNTQKMIKETKLRSYKIKSADNSFKNNPFLITSKVKRKSTKKSKKYKNNKNKSNNTVAIKTTKKMKKILIKTNHIKIKNKIQKMDNPIKTLILFTNRFQALFKTPQQLAKIDSISKTKNKNKDLL